MSLTAWQSELSKLLLKLTSRKDSEFFREPVQWETMGLVDYPSIIKSPMDFSTIKSKLNACDYKKPEEVARDIRQTFMNALIYNDPGSLVYAHAKSLSEFWEAQWATIYNVKDDVDRPPTRDEMVSWVNKCQSLSPKHLSNLLKELDRVSPSCLVKRKESNEVEVNVDLLTGVVFREIDSYVETVCKREV